MFEGSVEIIRAQNPERFLPDSVPREEPTRSHHSNAAVASRSESALKTS